MSSRTASTHSSFAIASLGKEDLRGTGSVSQEEQRLAGAVWALTRWAIERSQGPDAGLKHWLHPWSLQSELRDFVSGCSLPVAWKVADAVWDWAADQPAERAWLACSIDGPWLHGHPVPQFV